MSSPSHEPPRALGPVVHGPALLARSPGIAHGLRCIFGYPEGLVLWTVVRAEGVQAEAVSRHTALDGLSTGLILHAAANGLVRRLDAWQASSSSGDDTYDADAQYWLPELPGDGRLTLASQWPQAGLAAHSVVLHLADLGDLAGRTISLP